MVPHQQQKQNIILILRNKEKGLPYNGSNSFLFVNAAKIHKFKTKISEIKDYALCLSDTSEDLTINNMKRSGLKGIVKFFSVDFNSIDTNNILDILK